MSPNPPKPLLRSTVVPPCSARDFELLASYWAGYSDTAHGAPRASYRASLGDPDRERAYLEGHDAAAGYRRAAQ